MLCYMFALGLIQNAPNHSMIVAAAMCFVGLVLVMFGYEFSKTKVAKENVEA